ncbi:MAG: hypothetical protein OXI87_10465 [Albidovulum sp.]|nr:hypothetical protein [Albidovulum sp.]MDE0531008.1 hypothetical protein [Albidovulum sp.]
MAEDDRAHIFQTARAGMAEKFGTAWIPANVAAQAPGIARFEDAIDQQSRTTLYRSLR